MTRKLILIALVLAVINASSPTSNRMLNVESLTNSDNSIAYFRRLNVDSNKRELQAAPAKAGAKAKNSSVKPNVTVKPKVGKPVQSKSAKDQKAQAKLV